MSNFAFLVSEFPALCRDAKEAEKHALTAPKYSAILCRSVLEKGVNWLYENDGDLEEPYDTKLASLIHQPSFQEVLKPSMFREINVVRLTGNNAAHGRRISTNESLISLKNLFRFLSFLSKYYSETNPDIPAFDVSLIPDETEKEKLQAELQKKIDELEKEQEKLKQERQQREEQAEENELLKRQICEYQEEVAKRKEERKKSVDVKVAIPLLVSEAETRKLYIDLLLKEAGWDELRVGRELEFEVTGMPKSTNPSGIGYADYVLWGANGLPLAVVEAKKTMADPHKGQHQAELYANCLQKMFGQRPVIFYTNGFETYLWDDLFYPEREVTGFYSRDELQLMVDRRLSRTDLHNFVANKDIAGRPYQLEAIKRVAETLVTEKDFDLKGKRRKALLVMATGSGKTRVSAAIVDMLTKCNWAKRVLFLADRKALVSQAKIAFKEHLPHLTAIDLTEKTEKSNTRLVFSTYPTIMNKIDSMKNDDGRFYGVGHFDVVIVDEAHRSVYQKYKAIFDYFDSLLIGLTATPKTEVDRNTYGLFDIEDNNPTFAYELKQAVDDGYLVPPKAMSVPLKFPREGIRYSDLSEEEKAEYEEKFGDPTSGEVTDEISSNALNSWLFNTDTVDKVLYHLMTYGIKTGGGDRLGRTIIFAKNHKHALFIEERFNYNYPEYSGKFLRVIDNYEPKSQDLLDVFCDKLEEHYPQIAVSVDMMDTGVDAIRVVNLVFFKPVKSATKYWQMIGRGTRLCPNLFAPNENKTHFMIFDFCENFEFFEEFPDGIEPSVPKSLSQQIFEAKLEIGTFIRSFDESTEEDRGLAEEYIKDLHHSIAMLDQSRFLVRQHLKYVIEYGIIDRWATISIMDKADIYNHLSFLPVPNNNDDETAKRFDLLALRLQLAILCNAGNQATLIDNIMNIGSLLQPKTNIPAVKAKLATIKAVQNEQFWEEVNTEKIEGVRQDLRDLIKFIDRQQQQVVYTHFEDTLDKNWIAKEILPTYLSMKSYRDRVESYIRKNKDHMVIHKIQTNVPVTESELEVLEKMLFEESETGTKADFQREYGGTPLVKFIRSLLGLDKETANQLFAEFIQTGNLRADQITFINTIINYLTHNGTIDKAMLFEPPFTDLNDQGIMGLFDEVQVGKIIRIIDEVNEVGYG